jgi:hypothetical protein
MKMIDFKCYRTMYNIVSIKIPAECCGVKTELSDIFFSGADTFKSNSYCSTHMNTYDIIWNRWGKNQIIDSPIDMSNIPFMLFRTYDDFGEINVIKIPQECCGIKIEKSINNNFSQQEKIKRSCNHFMNIEDIWNLYGHTAMLKNRSCIKCNSISKAIPNQPDDSFICYDCVIK